MKASTQHRRIKTDQTIHPDWWTPVRTAVFAALIKRSEIAVRMKDRNPETRKVGTRWRPYTPARTKHLWAWQEMGAPRDGSKVSAPPIMTSTNVGPAVRNLSDWGYIHGTATTVRRVDFSPKGWAYAAATGLIEPAWLEVIYENHKTERDIAWRLYHQIVGSRKLSGIAEQGMIGVTEQVINDLVNPDETALENLPFVESEIPGLPQFDEEVTGILAKRVEDHDQVERIRLKLARSFHHHTGPALNSVEPQEIAAAIGQHFTGDEIVRADLEMTQRKEDGGLRETYYSRELLRRMSAAGQFKSPTLADHLDRGIDIGHGARGVSRIAVALETQGLVDEGLARHMPSTATLGEVYERTQRESITGIGEAIEATPENVMAANEAAQAEDDALPTVDWIDKHMGQYSYDGWVPEGQAAIVARKAVLRSTRQRINRSGFGDGHTEVPPEEGGTYFTGAALVIHNHDVQFEGRPVRVSLLIDSDYDERDTANVEAWFKQFVAQGSGADPRRSYHYPSGSRVEHEKVGEIELVKVTPAYHPMTAFALGALGGLVSLGGLLIVLSTIPNLN